MKLTHAKTILLPDEDMFEEVMNFYHKVIGLEYINGPNKYWVEFDTGTSRICLHENNRYDEIDDGRPKRDHIILTTDDKEGVLQKHKELQKMGYIASETTFPEKEHLLGAFFEKDSGTVLFMIKDPMGNYVQIESLEEGMQK